VAHNFVFLWADRSQCASRAGAEFHALADRGFTEIPSRHLGVRPLNAGCDHGRFIHVPPVQLSPTEHECPQLPQLLLSLMNDALLMHCPMQDV
jgi:hypothetical protein